MQSDPLGIYTSVTQWLKRKDRKSTRLNSSHVRISYAVFCLKKKFQIIKPLFTLAANAAFLLPSCSIAFLHTVRAASSPVPCTTFFFKFTANPAIHTSFLKDPLSG